MGGVFNAVNPSVYQSRENPIPAKQAYTLKNLQDWARLAGLKIVFPPPVFPVNSVKAMRGCLVAEALGRLVPFARACFEAYFRDCRDISDDAVLADLCAQTGIEPAAFFAGIAAPAVKQQLKDNTDEAIRRGAFGSPTIFVRGDDIYFGNDALPLVRAALARNQRN